MLLSCCGGWTLYKDVLPKMAMAKNWIPLVPSSNPTSGAVGCDLGCYSRTLVVIKLWGISAFTGLG